MSDYDDVGYYGQDSPYWAYNRPGWKPLCVRCNGRRNDCRKFNSTDLGTFAGEWLCTECRVPTDTLTPAEQVIDRMMGRK